MYPVYMKLRGYIQQLMMLSQKALTENSYNLSDSFYRSLMPCVVSVGVGIVLVILFVYFINFYFINPILMISKGISNYVTNKKSYNVTLDNTDELQDLNQNVADLVDINKKLEKQNNKNQSQG
jgi:signal transduction histidine kinase